MLKRAFDVVAAFSGLAVLWPVMLVAAIAVRRGSSGPAIFVQPRLGQGEKLFDCYKLRTMYFDTGHWPTHEVGASSITPAGRLLRWTKIDELPQLFNVIRGDMSLVGPRPCLPTQSQLIDDRRREGVFKVRPGITGLAQTMGVDMSDPAKLARLDGIYANEYGFLDDMRILIATLSGSGLGIDRTMVQDARPHLGQDP